jgi:hypothetical protein
VRILASEGGGAAGRVQAEIAKSARNKNNPARGIAQG